MKINFILILLLTSFGSLQAQTKSSTATSTDNMNESVRRAREQEEAYKAAQTNNPNEKPFAKMGAHLPAFQVVTWDEKSFFDSDLNPKKPLILVLFNPSCGHCVDVAKNLSDSLSKVKGAEIMFVTTINQLGEIKDFATNTGLAKHKNVVVSAENTDINKYLFEYNGVPQIMIYNKDKVLMKTFYKHADMDSLAYYIKKKK